MKETHTGFTRNKASEEKEKTERCTEEGKEQEPRKKRERSQVVYWMKGRH